MADVEWIDPLTPEALFKTPRSITGSVPAPSARSQDRPGVPATGRPVVADQTVVRSVKGSGVFSRRSTALPQQILGHCPLFHAEPSEFRQGFANGDDGGAIHSQSQGGCSTGRCETEYPAAAGPAKNDPSTDFDGMEQRYQFLR